MTTTIKAEALKLHPGKTKAAEKRREAYVAGWTRHVEMVEAAGAEFRSESEARKRPTVEVAAPVPRPDADNLLGPWEVPLYEASSRIYAAGVFIDPIRLGASIVHRIDWPTACRLAREGLAELRSS